MVWVLFLFFSDDAMENMFKEMKHPGRKLMGHMLMEKKLLNSSWNSKSYKLIISSICDHIGKMPSWDVTYS